MVTKIHADMNRLHTHTHTQLIFKNINKNKITREY